jgi:hypothetical protein
VESDVVNEWNNLSYEVFCSRRELQGKREFCQAKQEFCVFPKRKFIRALPGTVHDFLGRSTLDANDFFCSQFRRHVMGIQNHKKVKKYHRQVHTKADFDTLMGARRNLKYPMIKLKIVIC